VVCVSELCNKSSGSIKAWDINSYATVSFSRSVPIDGGIYMTTLLNKPEVNKSITRDEEFKKHSTNLYLKTQILSLFTLY
jgi:hypothetical protein